MYNLYLKLSTFGENWLEATVFHWKVEPTQKWDPELTQKWELEPTQSGSPSWPKSGSRSWPKIGSRSLPVKFGSGSSSSQKSWNRASAHHWYYLSVCGFGSAVWQGYIWRMDHFPHISTFVWTNFNYKCTDKVTSPNHAVIGLKVNIQHIILLL